MNKRTNKSNKQQAEGCLCQGLGPGLSDLLRRLGPPEQARQHFETARIEILKGLRALIDARIQQVSKRLDKGQKIQVE
jgi:hypothetical protein